jgi:hypothetical protein
MIQYVHELVLISKYLKDHRGCGFIFNSSEILNKEFEIYERILSL